jgi:hypothetical protein
VSPEPAGRPAAAAIAAALSPQSIPLGGSGITVTAKLVATAEGARAWTITLGGAIAGHTVNDVNIVVKGIQSAFSNCRSHADFVRERFERSSIDI